MHPHNTQDIPSTGKYLSTKAIGQSVSITLSQREYLQLSTHKVLLWITYRGLLSLAIVSVVLKSVSRQNHGGERTNQTSKQTIKQKQPITVELEPKEIEVGIHLWHLPVS